ncbi:MAG: class I SAM-dependent methyltransferase [Planctomycetota bacterium]
MAESTDTDALRQQWEALAPDWIQKVGDSGDAARQLLDPFMIQSCRTLVGGDLAGKRVVDIGCGEGRFTRRLAGEGATVDGIDPCTPLLDHARRLADSAQQFHEASAEALPFEQARFDLAVFYLSTCDMPDLAAALREAHRVLRPGGGCALCTIHPMADSPGGSRGWVRDYRGRKIVRTIDDYFDEGPFDCPLSPTHSVTNFRLTIQSHLDACLDAGFTLKRLIEPKPTADQLREHPGLDDEARVPSFILFQLTR